MRLRFTYQQIRNKLIKSVLIALVSPLLSSAALSAPAMAADPLRTVKFHVSNSQSATGETLTLINLTTSTKFSFSANSSDSITASITDGKYDAYLFANKDERGTRVASRFNFTLSGTISSITRINSYLQSQGSNLTITQDNFGNFELPLGTTGTLVTTLYGSETRTLSLDQVSGANGYNPGFTPNYYSDGLVGIEVEPGTFSFSGSDVINGDRASATCSVILNQISNCLIRISEKNFNFRATESNGETITTPTEFLLSFEKKNQAGNYAYFMSFSGSASGSKYLEDGEYRLRAYYTNLDSKLNKFSEFILTVTNGNISHAISTDLNSSIQIANGIYILKKKTFNFTYFVFNNLETLTSYYAYGYDASGKNFWENPDIYGKVQTSLKEGENTYYIVPSNTTSVVQTQLNITVLNGVVTKVLQDKVQLYASNGVFNISLIKANVQGTLQYNSANTSGWISGIYDLDASRFIDVKATSISSEGKYGLSLPRGRFKIGITPSPNGTAKNISYADCVIENIEITTTCNLNIGTPNFNFKILSNIDTITLGSTSIEISNRSALNGAYQTNGLSASSLTPTSLALQDGRYALVVKSDNPTLDGQNKKYTIQVSGNLVLSVIDDKSGQAVNAINGIFSLKLGTSNFNAIVKANGLPNPGSFSSSWQNGFDSLYVNSDSLGKLSFDLPNGRNELRVYPTNNESPTVVSNLFYVTVESGSVISVFNTSGETLTASNGVFSLDLLLPTIIGTATQNGQLVPGYVASAWNTVLNRQVDFQQNNNNGKYSVVVPSGNYDFLFQPNNGLPAVFNCNSTAGVQRTCNLIIPNNNIVLGIKSKSGTVLSNGVYASVERQFLDGQSFAGRGYSRSFTPSGDGKIYLSMVDGKYQILLYSNLPLQDGGSRRFSVEIESSTIKSFKDLDSLENIDTNTVSSGINLTQPNFTAQVFANGVGVSGSYVYINSASGKDFYKSYFTDSSGAFSEKIPDGEFWVYTNPLGDENPSVVSTNYRISVESGTVTTVLDRRGNPLTPNAGMYTLELPSPNVIGTITVNGNSAGADSYYINNVIDATSLNFVESLGQNFGSGRFGRLVDSGNYYFSVAKSGKPPVLAPCNVSSGLTTCNIDIGSDNFGFKIADKNGDILRQDVGASTELRIGNSGWGYWFQPSVGAIFTGNLKVPANSGIYYLFHVFPSDGSQRHGISQTYKVELNGESITSVSNFQTGETLTVGQDGLFVFKLGTPNLSGTVVGPDGSTPIPNAQVNAQSEVRGYGFGTDNSGSYALFINFDGTYTVYASAPEYDLTKSDSAKTEVQISGNSGASGLILKLRSPDVIATVTGPNGVSPNNFIQVLKRDTDGRFDYYGQFVTGRITNTQGKVAFYLDPGVYKFQTQADTQFANGGRTISSECVVTDTATVVNCSIHLNSSNLKIKLLGESGRPYSNASIYFNLTDIDKSATDLPTKNYDYAEVNIDGKSQLSLENGTWRGSVDIYGNGNESRMDLIAVIESGTVKSLSKNTGETFTASSDGFFLVQLPLANLSGLINVNGKRYTEGASVSIFQETSSGWENYQNRWVNNGKFAFEAKPGIYTIEIQPYIWSAWSTNSPVRTRKFNCIVPDIGSVACNVDMNTGNFNFKSVTPSGSNFASAWANVLKYKSDDFGNSYYEYIDYPQNRNGLFSTRLEDGKYQVNLQPYAESGALYSRALYDVVVESGTVTSVKRNGTSNNILSNDGIFQLAVSTPSVSGKVFKAGSSVSGVAWAEIIPINISTGEEMWSYATSANSTGSFALTLPDGTYDLYATSWSTKDGSGSTSSAKHRVTVVNDVGPTNLQILMRAPNFKVRVVDPRNSSLGLSNTWVWGNFNNGYFHGSTDNNGYFQAFLDTTTGSTCIGECRLWIYPDYLSKLVQNSETFTNIGDIGTISPLVPNTNITIYIPTNGVKGMPDKWSWFMVSELDSATNVIEEFGYGTNENGRASIALKQGHKYKITAYPSGEYYGRYSPTSILINSFDAISNADISITFASPNVTFIVRDTLDVGNAWGWYQVFQISGGAETLFIDGYLNEQGRGAQYLTDGNYRVIFHPGKSRGVEKEISFTVTSGHVTNLTGGSNSNDVITSIMGTGNVSGTVRNSHGEALANAVVTATSTSGPAVKVTTVSKSDGSFELNLVTTQSWSLGSLDPLTLEKATVLISANAANYTGIAINLTP